jgi:hypothetical protein
VLKTKDVYISLETEYPFKNTFKYTVKAEKDFTLVLRVPSFAQNYTVNGKKYDTDEVLLTFSAGEESVVTVSFDVTPVFAKRAGNLNTVEMGSLLFSLPIKYHTLKKEYERDGVERKFPYCDYEYYPLTPWQFGFADTDLEAEYRDVWETPFSSQNPPVTVKAKVKEIAWGYADGYDTVCAKYPESRVGKGEITEVELYPYGCAKLRMTELPFCEEE